MSYTSNQNEYRLPEDVQSSLAFYLRIAAEQFARDANASGGLGDGGRLRLQFEDQANEANALANRIDNAVWVRIGKGETL